MTACSRSSTRIWRCPGRNTPVSAMVCPYVGWRDRELSRNERSNSRSMQRATFLSPRSMSVLMIVRSATRRATRATARSEACGLRSCGSNGGLRRGEPGRSESNAIAVASGNTATLGRALTIRTCLRAQECALRPGAEAGVPYAPNTRSTRVQAKSLVAPGIEDERVSVYRREMLKEP